MASPPSVNVARLSYLLVCIAAGLAIALSTRGSSLEVPVSTGILAGIALGAVTIWIETLMKGFTLRGLSTATFGLGVGLFCAWLLTRVQISGLVEIAFRDRFQSEDNLATMIASLKLAIDVALYASFGFLGIVLALRGSPDDFAFIIPYVRFRHDVTTGQPMVLDLESVIDGRVKAVLKSGFLNGRLIVPGFVLTRLHEMSGKDENGDRQRGQRGLGFLEEMRKDPEVQISIHDTKRSTAGADQNTRLIELARLLGARLMTLDESLTKVAKLQGVQVLNLMELDDALRPEIAVGQRMRVALVRTGKEDHQAVGYLPDGMMIVVNHAAHKMGGTADVVVMSILQTTAGRMVFAELYGTA
ncbi:MAG: hypothetical protein V4733_05610 [Verrucomicrobiota bacterium]